MEETNTLTRDQLLKLVQKLAASNDANKELITQESQKIVNASGDGKSKSDKRGNPNSKKSRFDMSKFRQRHIAFQIQYDGRKFFGFAAQDGSGVDTVENFFFQALERLNLISDRKTCGYSRCGRTDRGVSALGQIVALKVRSSIPTNVELTDDNAELREMDYCTMLNRCLPEEIRVLGWTAVTDEFSSRFSASNRRYRYFFVRRNLDIAAMQQACQYLLGSHDFRNLCKLDVANVSNFVREIYSAEIKPFRIHDEHEVVYMLEICGIAFLWHMVRCIMAVLFLVGEGKESPEIVRDLLDLTVYASKPSYMMADDAPLVLHECAFDHLALHHSVRSLWELTSHYRLLQDRHAVAMAQAFNALQHLEASCVVSRTDLNAFKEELRGKQARVAKRLESKGIQKTAVGAAAAASAPTDGDGATVGKKRSFAAMETDAAVAAAAAVESDRVSWTQALKEIQSELSLHPSPDTAPHVPLSQRKREESYEERVKTLVGQKKNRFERHVQLRSVADGALNDAAAAGEDDAALAEDIDVGGAGPQSASTKAFFAHMRQQGSITLLGGYAVHGGPTTSGSAATETTLVTAAAATAMDDSV